MNMNSAIYTTGTLAQTFYGLATACQFTANRIYMVPPSHRGIRQRSTKRRISRAMRRRQRKAQRIARRINRTT